MRGLRRKKGRARSQYRCSHAVQAPADVDCGGMHTPLKLDTDVIQDRVLALQAALDNKAFQPEQIYAALLAISQELLFIAEDFDSRQMNDIVPGANVTF